MKRVALVFGVIAMSAGAEGPLSDQLSRKLFKAAEIDGSPGITLSELETVLGKPDKKESKGVFGPRPTLVYLLSQQHQLHVTAIGDSVEFVALVPPNGKWELLWK